MSDRTTGAITSIGKGSFNLSQVPDSNGNQIYKLTTKGCYKIKLQQTTILNSNYNQQTENYYADKDFK
jgi:hypothetical protein